MENIEKKPIINWRDEANYNRLIAKRLLKDKLVLEGGRPSSVCSNCIHFYDCNNQCANGCELKEGCLS